MTNIHINASTGYDVTVGAGASESAADFICGSLRRVRKVAVVTDSNVDGLHSASVVSRLAAAGLKVEKLNTYAIAASNPFTR